MTTHTIETPEQRIRHQRFAAPKRWSLYWAYGSNLSVHNMFSRCPRAEPVGKLMMNHMALVFRGVADVVVKKGSRAPGALWRINQECEDALDRFEGVRQRVYLKRYFTVTIDGQKEDVLFYQMRTNRGVQPPSEVYLDTIAAGYSDFELDLRYLDRALSEAWSQRDVTPELWDRYSRRGRPKLAKSLPWDPDDPTTGSNSNHFVLTDEELRMAGAT